MEVSRRRQQKKGKPMQLDGQKIIVTGGAAGIGGAISRLLAERGAKVVAVDINED
ncbi:SDR family NAD(P)-dependent oxidoreductase, partial [Brevibacterium paucivorans]|uniref:SDR family NAD(P)-dependent oxidoreductase n=1 Tax=Brevibacterium paucivorans TaxID=170994 RepID=UPI0035713FA8